MPLRTEQWRKYRWIFHTHLFSFVALYELPGGNLDFGEEIFACVERETLEETGLKVRGKKVIAYTNDIQKVEDKHEVTLYVLCEREDSSQQPEVTTLSSRG